jgi:outer membrane lipoprotein-sorting protein
MRRAHAGPALVVVAWLIGSGAAAAETGPRALFDHALRSTRDARATFRQTRTDALGSTTQSGRLEYRKPRQVRLEWTGKAAATAIVNRDTVWFYQPSQKSVLKSSAAAGGAPPAVFLEESIAVLERAYAVRETGALGLELTPRGAHSPWSKIAFTLDPGTGWPRRMTLTARDGTSTRLDFERFVVNQGASAARFAPRFPPGVEVLEL